MVSVFHEPEIDISMYSWYCHDSIRYAAQPYYEIVDCVDRHFERGNIVGSCHFLSTHIHQIDAVHRHLPFQDPVKENQTKNHILFMNSIQTSSYTNLSLFKKLR